MSRPPVIIIAGGANSRFFPFQEMGHKGTFHLLGESLMIRTLKNLQEHGFSEIVMIISQKDADTKLTQNLIEQADIKIKVTLVTQSTPVGMGDAVLRGVSALPDDETVTDPVGRRYAVVSAYQINAGEVLAAMLDHGQETVVASTVTDRPWDYGMLTFNESGRAVGLVEKPKRGSEPSLQKILSIYVLSQRYIQLLSKAGQGEYNFEEALAEEFKLQPAPVYQLQIQLPSLKYPWHVLDFQQELMDDLTSYCSTTAQISPTAVIDEALGPVHIGENAIIGHAARIVGPAYIGDRAHVGDFSLVRSSSLEADVEVGCFSEIARSAIGQGTHAHSGYIGDSVIGSNCKIGAQVITANKRLDRGSVGVQIKGKVVDSGRRNLGVMIGQGAQLGVRVSTMPGKCIGAHAVIQPHQVVTENILSPEKEKNT